MNVNQTSKSAGKRTREEYAVRESIRNAASKHEAWDAPLLEEITPLVREAIEEALKSELARALGASRYARVGERAGYRNGTLTRDLGTPMGRVTVEIPRARVNDADGEREWRSEKLPRYARRMRGIDKAVVSIYLSGTNQRRIEAALRPLLKDLPLSKSAVSRLAARLREEREAWMSRDLSEEKIVEAFLDGFGVLVRRDGRVVRNPVLVIIGVKDSGEKVLLALRMAGAESTAGWEAAVEDLTRRGLKPPVLCVIDGNDGLRKSIEKAWPAARVQRCTVHKLRNLLAHAPKHAHELVREDYNRIVYAETESAARSAREKFLTRWRKRCAAVATSLEEAGEELLTFYCFPKAQWKSLRTTNVIERVNEELRRRVKTQGPHPSEEAVLNVIFGLFAAGMIRLRKVDGWQTLTEVIRSAA